MMFVRFLGDVHIWMGQQLQALYPYVSTTGVQVKNWLGQLPQTPWLRAWLAC